jgi:hypothetical protein
MIVARQFIAWNRPHEEHRPVRYDHCLGMVVFAFLLHVLGVLMNVVAIW